MSESNCYPLTRREPEGVVIWLTGLPSSGKSSLAEGVKKVLNRYKKPVVLIDSDEMRSLLTPNPTYEPEERDRFYQSVGDLAVWLAGSGINVIIAATAHKRRYRDELRDRVDRFAEVWVDCPLEECIARDPKGLYARAARDKDNRLPGVGVVYEPPLDPELTIDTSRLFPRQAAELLVNKLAMLELINLESAIPIAKKN